MNEDVMETHGIFRNFFSETNRGVYFKTVYLSLFHGCVNNRYVRIRFDLLTRPSIVNKASITTSTRLLRPQPI